jgi:AhpD family alkylhydroperoxidase
MEEKTTILMSLSVATAVHCVPCFEHYYGMAVEAGLTDEEIKEAAKIAKKVKKGAEFALKNSISEIMGGKKQAQSSYCAEQTEASSSCCG